MSVASIGTTKHLELSEYLDERDSRVFRGRADLVIEELRNKADAIGMRNKRVRYRTCRLMCNSGIFGIVIIDGDVEFSG